MAVNRLKEEENKNQQLQQNCKRRNIQTQNVILQVVVRGIRFVLHLQINHFCSFHLKSR